MQFAHRMSPEVGQNNNVLCALEQTVVASIPEGPTITSIRQMFSIWCSICPTNIASVPNLHSGTDSQIRQPSGRWGWRTVYVLMAVPLNRNSQPRASRLSGFNLSVRLLSKLSLTGSLDLLLLYRPQSAPYVLLHSPLEPGPRLRSTSQGLFVSQVCLQQRNHTRLENPVFLQLLVA